MACLALRIQGAAVAFGSTGGSINLSQTRSSSTLAFGSCSSQSVTFPAFGRRNRNMEASATTSASGELSPSVEDDVRTSSFVTADAIRDLIASSCEGAESRWYAGLFGLPEVDWAGVLPDTGSFSKEPPAQPLPSSTQEGFAIGGDGEKMASRRIEPMIPTNSGSPNVRSRPRQQVVFTAEKAKLLRRELRKHQSWHDTMYHSSTASRLAVADH